MKGGGARRRRRAHRRGQHEAGPSKPRQLRSGAIRNPQGRDYFPEDFEGTWGDYLGTDEGPAFYAPGAD